MNKTELIDALASMSGVTKVDAETVLSSFMEITTKELKKGGEVVLTGFGKFVSSTRAARSGINPSTGDKIQIPASKTAKFKVGSALKKAMNSK